MIKLNDDLKLSIDRYDNRARLIIYKGDEEYVCRKSTRKELNTILSNDDIHLFNGRLQLFRSGDAIAVEVKGKPEGVVSVKEFNNAIQAITS